MSDLSQSSFSSSDEDDSCSEEPKSLNEKQKAQRVKLRRDLIDSPVSKMKYKAVNKDIIEV
jgi:hypothetical protein